MSGHLGSFSSNEKMLSHANVALPPPLGDVVQDLVDEQEPSITGANLVHDGFDFTVEDGHKLSVSKLLEMSWLVGGFAAVTLLVIIGQQISRSDFSLNLACYQASSSFEVPLHVCILCLTVFVTSSLQAGGSVARSNPCSGG